MRWQTPNSILVFSTLRSSYGFLVNLPPPHIIALGSRETQAKASQYISFIVFLLFFYFLFFIFIFFILLFNYHIPTSAENDNATTNSQQRIPPPRE